MYDDTLRQTIKEGLRRIGGKSLGTFPEGLGRIVRLAQRGDRLIAYTDRGGAMIMYAPTGEEEDE